jgi:hypothetical protein
MHHAKRAVGALVEEEQNTLADRELRVGEDPAGQAPDLAAQLPDRQRGLGVAPLEYLVDGERDVRAQLADRLSWLSMSVTRPTITASA